MRSNLIALSVLLLSSAGYADTSFTCRNSDRHGSIRNFEIVVGKRAVTGTITRHNVIGFETRRVVIGRESDLTLNPRTLIHRRGGVTTFTLGFSDLYNFYFTLYDDGVSKSANIRTESDGDPVTDSFRCR